jgi:hypothetical protein
MIYLNFIRILIIPEAVPWQSELLILIEICYCYISLFEGYFINLAGKFKNLRVKYDLRIKKIRGQT